jgi:hypothetical protein
VTGGDPSGGGRGEKNKDKLSQVGGWAGRIAGGQRGGKALATGSWSRSCM